MKRTNQELFGRAVGLEKLLIERHGNTYESIFLTPAKSHMGNAVPDPTMNMFADDDIDYSCESGHCMT